jgi:uncharacterized membrane protein (Fun14 family)
VACGDLPDLAAVLAGAADLRGRCNGGREIAGLLPVIGLGPVSGLVAGVAVAGLVAIVALLPEPKGISLEQLAAIGN